MYSTYQLQLPIFHAICMILPMNISFHISTSWQTDILFIKNGLISFNQYFVYYLLPFNFFFLLYSIYMIKGVSKKKIHYNLIYCIYIYYFIDLLYIF